MESVFIRPGSGYYVSIISTKQISAPEFIRKVKNMAKKPRRSRISKNQRKILEILERYDELTARDIAEILWARDIRYKTPEYSSVHRSLTTLCKKGLVEKVGGQLKWRRRKA